MPEPPEGRYYWLARIINVIYQCIKRTSPIVSYRQEIYR